MGRAWTPRMKAETTSDAARYPSYTVTVSGVSPQVLFMTSCYFCSRPAVTSVRDLLLLLVHWFLAVSCHQDRFNSI